MKRKYNHPNKLTDIEKRLIREHSHLSIHHVSLLIERSFTIVKRYIEENNLPYVIKGPGRVKQEPKEPAKVVKMVRPPAVYSNTDWRQKYATN